MKHIKVKKDKLYTPILKHRKGDLTITNIGAIHFGEQKYYDKIQEEMDRIPFGYYEFIKPLKNAENIPESRKKYVPVFEDLKNAHKKFSNLLGLHPQSDMLKYPENWENPDVTLDELISISSDSFLSNISYLGDDLEILDRLYGNEPEELAKLLKATMKYTSKIPFLTKPVDLITSGPAFDKVNLEYRNKKLFNELEKEIKNPRSNEIGTVYGAPHLDGIDNYLRNNGFHVEGEKWVLAWDLKTDLNIFQFAKKIKDEVKNKPETLQLVKNKIA